MDTDIELYPERYHGWGCPVCSCVQADPPSISFTQCGNGHAVELIWHRGALREVLALDDDTVRLDCRTLAAVALASAAKDAQP